MERTEGVSSSSRFSGEVAAFGVANGWMDSDQSSGPNPCGNGLFAEALHKTNNRQTPQTAATNKMTPTKARRDPEHTAAATPTRKTSVRPAMRKKSPYQSPAKAGKGKWTAKKTSAAKQLSPLRKSAGKSLTVEQKKQARLRAKEWAERELGRKKNAPPSPLAAPDMIVIDNDEEDYVELKTLVAKDGKVASSAGSCKNGCANCDSLREQMLELDIENIKMKKDIVEDVLNKSSDDATFYDALEYIPAQHDVTVEDVSDNEDEEIRDLGSARRNRTPSRGQWMEPIAMEPPGLSYSTFEAKFNP